MSSLGQIYKQKGSNGIDITVRKTHLVPIDDLYVEEGYNVREIDEQHVEEFKQAYINGEYIPPVAVQVTQDGIKVIDGHHRYYGAIKAAKEGYEIARIECKDFVGTEADRVAFMVTSSQGKPLTAIERAKAYQRMSNQGWSNSEIAKKVKRSITDVDNHLRLLMCDDDMIAMIKNGEMAAATAIEAVNEYGVQAGDVVKEKLSQAKEQGKKKITKDDVKRKFSANKAHRFIAVIVEAGVLEYLPAEAQQLAEEYQDSLKG